MNTLIAARKDSCCQQQGVRADLARAPCAPFAGLAMLIASACWPQIINRQQRHYPIPGTDYWGWGRGVSGVGAVSAQRERHASRARRRGAPASSRLASLRLVIPPYTCDRSCTRKISSAGSQPSHTPVLSFPNCTLFAQQRHDSPQHACAEPQRLAGGAGGRGRSAGFTGLLWAAGGGETWRGQATSPI